MLDPVVMFPSLLRCLNSYADADYRASCPRTFLQELAASAESGDPLLSPLLIPKEGREKENVTSRSKRKKNVSAFVGLEK